MYAMYAEVEFYYHPWNNHIFYGSFTYYTHTKRYITLTRRYPYILETLQNLIIYTPLSLSFQNSHIYWK